MLIDWQHKPLVTNCNVAQRIKSDKLLFNLTRFASIEKHTNQNNKQIVCIAILCSCLHTMTLLQDVFSAYHSGQIDWMLTKFNDWININHVEKLQNQTK